MTAGRALRVLVIAEHDLQYQIVLKGCGSASGVERTDILSLPKNTRNEDTAHFDILIVSSTVASQQMLIALEAFAHSSAIPILWFVDGDEEKLAASSIRRGVTTFVSGGLSSERIKTLVAVTTERHQMYQEMNRELKNASEELATRKIVERAKGLLMKGKNLSEEDAYKAMRSMAMNQGKTMKDIAKSVISLSDLMN